MWYRCTSNLVLGDNLKINPIAEHKDKSYIIHFMNIPPELLYYSFNKRWQLEEFIYRNGIEQFKYKSMFDFVRYRVSLQLIFR